VGPVDTGDTTGDTTSTTRRTTTTTTTTTSTGSPIVTADQDTIVAAAFATR
jgi:hypothetical protein